MRLCITVNLDYAQMLVPNFHRTDREALGGYFLNCCAMLVGSGNKCLVLSNRVHLITKGNLDTVKRLEHSPFVCIHSNKGLILETPALESLYSGQITFSYQLC